MEFIILIILAILFGITGSLISKGKGNDSAGGFVLGLFFGPIGILISYFISNNEEAIRNKTGYTKLCEYCSEYVKYTAIVCKHCGREFEQKEVETYTKSEKVEDKSKDNLENYKLLLIALNKNNTMKLDYSTDSESIDLLCNLGYIIDNMDSTYTITRNGEFYLKA